MFNAEGNSAYVIELKRAWTRKTCFTDIERLLAALRACDAQVDGSLRNGMLGVLIVKFGSSPETAKRKTCRRVKAIEEDVRDHFGLNDSNVTFSCGDMVRFPRKYEFEKEWFAASFCITLSS